MSMNKPNASRIHGISAVFGLFMLLLSSCGDAGQRSITVMLEDGVFSSPNKIQKGQRGRDFSFDVILPYDKSIFGASYSDYSLTEEPNADADKRYEKITFHQVKYDTVITLQIGDAGQIIYRDGDIEFSETINYTHLRANVSNDYYLFAKPGYKLSGFQNEDGEVIGLGSRAFVSESKTVTLAPFYVQESPSDSFTINEIEGNEASVSGYVGLSDIVVVPDMINGKKVTRIESDAFSGLHLASLTLPRHLKNIRPASFKNATIDHLVMFDDIETMDEQSFEGAVVDSIRINAVSNPAYLPTYFGSYPDKYDRLLSLKDKKKIILYSGSSTRFGFDSSLLDQAFPNYEVVNMGVYAYTESLPQIDAIVPLLKEGDIVIVSPEFDTPETQINVDASIDYAFFAMAESDFDILTQLRPSDYQGYFSSLGQFFENRAHLERHSYSLSPNLFDEDGNRVSSSSYNAYGDYCLFRENNEERKSFGIRRAYYNKKHFPMEDLDLFNAAMQKMKDAGAEVYYDYSPRMENSISEDSDKASILELGQYLKENLELPFLSTIEDSLIDPYYFYGTDNHLSTEGAKIRTERVIESLKAALNSK